MRFDLNELRSGVWLIGTLGSLLIAQLSDIGNLVLDLFIDVIAHHSLRSLRSLRLKNTLLILDLRRSHLILSHSIHQDTNLITLLLLDFLVLLASRLRLLLVLLPLLDERQIVLLELHEMVVEILRVAEGQIVAVIRAVILEELLDFFRVFNLELVSMSVQLSLRRGRIGSTTLCSYGPRWVEAGATALCPTHFKRLGLHSVSLFYFKFLSAC